ncbi:family 43 glycosylhydrolase [Prevotella sp. PINT]|jgi:Glycosyl hydrolases family 43.|uniref:family 43 glycosylhydrolase n=1 Tax=Palleniella intestinalis TaxID=2736291 RepID=UPI001552B961|nr:family 43 glycosylhydrolase [Palleniella intestinalis]NPD82058.1 family 43 glycosylhydrolase [Palleniella intestinalis]
MKRKIYILSCMFVAAVASFAQKAAVINGVPWYDRRDSTVNAHGVNIIYDNGRYYMFGESKTDSANVFNGFSCYSSDNLTDWQFERIALPMQKDGRLGPMRIGERPKVLRCPTTGEFVMIAHSDDRRYKDPCVVYATSPTVNGEYTYRGPLLYKGNPIRRWDIGSFADDDGRAYLLVHHGSIYRFSEDFHSLDSCIISGQKGVGESPAMMKKDGIYYWLSSHTTSWERNDNMYFTATSLSGPWTYRGEFCPKGSLTYNSQCSFVLPVKQNGSTSYMYMGDRWSFPRQRSAATQVWLPIQAKDGRLSIPEYKEVWNPFTGQAVELAGIRKPLDWQSCEQGAVKVLSLKLKKNNRIIVKGRTANDGGYALVRIVDNKGNERHRQLIDFYSKVPADGIRYVSPRLPKGAYRLEIEVTGLKSNWSDKKGNVYGTTGTYVRIDAVEVY